MVSKKRFVGFLFFILICAFAQFRIPQAMGGEYVNFKIKEVPLTVARKSVKFDVFLEFPTPDIVFRENYAAFFTARKAWIKLKGKKLIPLEKFVKLPKGFNWHEGAFAGDDLIISVADYTEKQLKKDMATSRGGFVAGPDPVGILVVEIDPPGAKLIKSFKVDEKSRIGSDKSNFREDYKDIPEDMLAPKEITPVVQSFWQEGKYLYAGNYGSLLKLNINEETAEIIELDEMLINRVGLWKEGKTLWYLADEGGMDGAWIEKLEGKKSWSFRLLNEAYIYPDRILRYDGRLLTSSGAGVVEVDEADKTYIHYQFGKDKKKMGVFKLGVINGALWGVRDDGWVRFNLKNKSATHYRLEGKGVSNSVQSVALFDGKWYIATDKQVVVLKSPL